LSNQDGFLSENHHFVDRVERANLNFIGPSSKSMALMGDKVQSKKVAKDLGISLIPGSDNPIQSLAECTELANAIGYPVILKAAASGGGKGIRIVEHHHQLAEAFALVKSEALSSFGDDRIILEKFLDKPRHIEIQLLGDKFGNCVYFPERECSIQRRHQKIIEESPSTFIDDDIRHMIGQQAVSLAKKVGYYSAGTCEFLVDSAKFCYFLELNSRLQVEHPITESITGLDLVEQMIRVACNERLALKQQELKINGWALEARIYAEDPSTYIPSSGMISPFFPPDTNSARCDLGVSAFSEVPIHYDPLIAKISTHSQTRFEAISKLRYNLDRFVVGGIKTNIPLLYDILNNESFTKGVLSTSFLKDEYPNGLVTREIGNDIFAVFAFIFARKQLYHYDDHIYTPNNLECWLNAGGVNVSAKIVIESLDKMAVHIRGEKIAVRSSWTPGQVSVSAEVNKKKYHLNYVNSLPTGFSILLHGVSVPENHIDSSQCTK
jgi:propionyl-CoA carboxylase alpha chain